MASGSQHCPGSFGNLCSLSLWLLLFSVDGGKLEREEKEEREIPDYTKRQEGLHAPYQICLCEGELLNQVLLTHFVKCNLWLTPATRSQLLLTLTTLTCDRGKVHSWMCVHYFSVSNQMTKCSKSFNPPCIVKMLQLPFILTRIMIFVLSQNIIFLTIINVISLICHRKLSFTFQLLYIVI